MKRIILAICLSFAMASFSCSKSTTNDDHVTAPAAVNTAFNTRYPTASGEIEWQKEDGNTYKVKFFIGSQRWQAIFAADGTFISETKI